MQIETTTRYYCEVCGTGYLDARLAEACQAARPRLTACPVEPGDAVEVQERYGDPAPDRVVAVRVGPSLFPEFAAEAEGRDADYYLRLYESGEVRAHEWLVRVERAHSYGKDASAYTDEHPLRRIYQGGRRLASA